MRRLRFRRFSTVQLLIALGLLFTTAPLLEDIEGGELILSILFSLVLLAARKRIVRECCVGPDENVVFDVDSVPELNAAFDRYPIADDDIVFDKGVVADITFRTNVRTRQDMGKCPNAGIISDGG